MALVRAVDVGTAAVIRARRCRGRTARPAAVAVLAVEIVGPRLRIGVLDFRQRGLEARQGRAGQRGVDRIVRRNGRGALVVAEVHRVAGAEHDVIGAGAAQDGLMVVVAHRIAVGEEFQIGRVAGLHIVEAHRRRAFARRFVVEARNLRRAVLAGAHRGLDPGEEIVRATGRVRRRNRKGRAVELLPHLEQPMNRARVVGVVRMRRAGDLEARPAEAKLVS